MSRERADARRYRDALLDAAAAELRAGRALKVQRVAAAAGVSRSTIYRHFQDADGLERAVVEAALQQAQEAAERGIRQTRAPLANARAAIIGLVEVGAHHGLAVIDPAALVEGCNEIAVLLEPAGRRILEAADAEPLPSRWLRTALTHLVLRALRAAT